MRTVLTIAGSDSSGGAGLQADLKTFAAHGVFGMTAITAITAQNTRDVTLVEPLSAATVTAQIDAVAQDLPIHAIKIGMLANAGIVDAVAAAIERHQFRLVVLDTVMVSKSGARLLDAEAVEALRARLLPLATIITPNVPEAEVLVGRPLEALDDVRAAARQLLTSGARAVLLTGGHLVGPPVDVFAESADTIDLPAERIDTLHTHGTGCTISAAIAARLALGDDLLPAVRSAKRYVTEAIRRAPGLGGGHGPLGHFF